MLFTTKLNYSFHGTLNKGTGNGGICEGQQPVISKQLLHIIVTRKRGIVSIIRRRWNTNNCWLLKWWPYVYTDFHRSCRETQEGNTLTDILSDADGDTYLITAEGFYEKRLGKVRYFLFGGLQGIKVKRTVFPLVAKAVLRIGL